MAYLQGATSAGSWIPVLNINGLSDGILYAVQTGSWILVAPLVFINARLTLLGKGKNRGNITVTGLPYLSMDGNTQYQVFIVPQANMSYTNSLQGSVPAKSNTIHFNSVGPGQSNSTPLSDTNISDNSDIIIHGFYFCEG